MLSIRHAEAADNAKRLADAHRHEVGFVLRPVLEASIRKRELLEVIDDVTGECVAFVRFHQCRDGWTTIYEIVSIRRGAGRLMLEAVKRPTRLKCPVDDASNGFWAHVGARLVATVPGKKRALNVWHLDGGTLL